MNAKENARLNELRLVINLVDVDRKLDGLAFKNYVSLLCCLALAIGREPNNHLYEIIKTALSTNYLGASDKEIIATCKTFFKPTVAAKKLGYTYPYYTTKYADLLSRDYIKEEWLNDLKPLFPDDVDLIKFVNSFIEGFNFPVGIRNSSIENDLRTYELEFWIIYTKLNSIFQNDVFLHNFIKVVCNTFGIDYDTINYLESNIYRISRSYPVLKYNKQYFLQELINMCYAKGIKRGTIGKDILGQDTHYLYNNKRAVTENILGTEVFDCIYVPTLTWNSLDKISVNRFISIFYDFVENGNS